MSGRYEPLRCPVCTESIAPRKIDWLERVARCDACELSYWLGDVLLRPAHAVAGYPDRLLAARPPPEPSAKLHVEERGGERWFRPPGWRKFVSPTVVVAPDRVELRPRIDPPHREPLATLRGFMPAQRMEWDTTSPWVNTVTVLLSLTAVHVAFRHPTWDAAAAAASALNAAVDAVRPVPAPYR